MLIISSASVASEEFFVRTHIIAMYEANCASLKIRESNMKKFNHSRTTVLTFHKKTIRKVTLLEFSDNTYILNNNYSLAFNSKLLLIKADYSFLIQTTKLICNLANANNYLTQIPLNFYRTNKIDLTPTKTRCFRF